MNDLNAPIDHSHQEAVAARQWINAIFLEAKIEVARWVPKPCPENWKPHVG